ncbi:CoA transferase [Streptomyces capitiformicae]|uniref:CoA transferase n=1 Tax=Streptomyces capitiformicae TaxID=2014920 RepID=A0A919DI54_9ACTN|nr:CoA transferase [Streptomyces capitiformicae]GHE46744.1 CoA transferase [Streptomyces capitiformicae]
MSTADSTRVTGLLPASTRVVELGETFSTALAGRFLERLGAHVTRVVPTGEEAELDTLGPRLGDDEHGPSAAGVWLRQNKDTIDLDPRAPEARARLDDLLDDADVVLIAGTTSRWSEKGIDLDDVRRRASRAVIGHVTAWGDDGPRTHLRSNELLLQAAGGFMNLVGSASREPVRLGSHPLQATAGLLVLDGVMIGLFHRQSTGQATSFETSEFEAAAHLEWKIASTFQTGRPIERRGDEGGGPLVARTRDGYFGLFFTPRDWDGVKEMLGDPRLGDPRFATPRSRALHERELKELVEETTLPMSKKELYARAQARSIPSGYVATMSDLLDSPQYRARDFFQWVEVPGVGTGEIPDAPWVVRTIDDLDEEDAV